MSWYKPWCVEGKGLRWTLQFDWGEVSTGGDRWLALNWWKEDDATRDTLMVSLLGLTVFLKMRPVGKRPVWAATDDPVWEIGFTLGSDTLHVHRGHRTSVLWLPWSWDWHSTEILLPMGGYSGGYVVLWREDCGQRKRLYAERSMSPMKDFEVRREVEKRTEQRFVVTTRNGIHRAVRLHDPGASTEDVEGALVAVVTARLEKRAWRLRMLPGIPLKTAYSLWVESDRELGSQVGTWKGGTLGFGIELDPKERWENVIERGFRERIR